MTTKAVTNSNAFWQVNLVGGPVAFTDTFTAMTGAEPTTEISDEFDGGTNRPVGVVGNTTWSNIVLTIRYDPERHPNLVRQLRAVQGTGEFTVVKEAMTRTWNVVPDSKTSYPNCLLLAVKDPETDRQSAARNELQLTLWTSGPSAA